MQVLPPLLRGPARGRFRPGASPSPRAALLAGALLLLPAAAGAQRGGPEFVRQGLLVPEFNVADGMDPRAAVRAGNEARSAARKRSNGREVDVIDVSAISATMEKAGYQSAERYTESDLRVLGRHARADEYLYGIVMDDGRSASGARVGGTLVLMRDPRLRQPLPDAVAPKLDDAATRLGESLAASRAQLPHARRCENALREGNAAAAVTAARAGVAAYPQATIARTCLVWALRASGAPAAQVVGAAREVLAVDSMSFYALEAAAVALDTLRRHAESAPLWSRLARTNFGDFELTERALYALYYAGSLEAAENLAALAAESYPGHLPLTRHVWRIAYERQNWSGAIAAGEFLLARDSLAIADPTFYRRLATAYRTSGHPFKAIEIAARGVAAVPGDARLYSLYAQYVLAEADTALPRGLATFPQNGELLALHAQQLRAGGKLTQAVEAMRTAIAFDPGIPDGALMLAQSELELGEHDSALASLQRALAGGTDSARIAQFAFARGNALYRAAQTSNATPDYALALRFLSLSDSVRATPQTQLMVGMAALGTAQAAFTGAVAEKGSARRCELARQGAQLLPVARASLEGGRDVSTEAVDQGLAYVGQLEPYALEALKGYCGQ